MGRLSDDEQRLFESIVQPLRPDLGWPDPPRPRLRVRALRRRRPATGRPARRWADSLPLICAVAIGLLALVAVLPDVVSSVRAQAPAPTVRQLPVVPVGTTGAHEFIHTLPSGDPVTFNPCRPIHWELNPAGMPAGAEPMLHQAMAEVSARTGLRLVYLGTTERRADGELNGASEKPVLVTWSDEDATPDLEGSVAGIAGPIGSRHRTEYSSGQVVLDGPQLAAIMTDRPDDVRLIMLHEFAHLVGLDHVDDPRELMNPELIDQTGWGPGDLQGLALLGQGSCG